MSTINETIKQLEAARVRAAQEVAALTSAISALVALGSGTAPKSAPVVAAKPARKAKISAAGRARIVAAQKKRWAKIKAGKPASKPAAAKSAVKAAAKPAKKKRTMSPEAIAKIVAAQKARWAKIRAEKAPPAA